MRKKTSDMTLEQLQKRLREAHARIGFEGRFAFTIDQGTGEVSMAQYRAINHGNEEGEFGAPDEVATMLSGKLSVTLAVTDKDGDTVSASKDISGSITFDDDGPIVDKGSGTLTPALDRRYSAFTSAFCQVSSCCLRPNLEPFSIARARRVLRSLRPSVYSAAFLKLRLSASL